MLDKAVQVDPAELQQMPPFVRLQTLSSTNVAPLLGSGSPEPQELAVKREDLLPVSRMPFTNVATTYYHDSLLEK